MKPPTLTPQEEERDARQRLQRMRRAQAAKKRLDEQRRRERQKTANARRRWMEREGELFHRYRTLADSTASAERVADAYHAWVAHWSQGAPGA